ncbi:MAG: methenyltetrahydromethanopterin cyclohydrolase [Planctomycetaceae bacterium]|nr:MAG: methenyltetrahydromethanopterin cyclohydrolase [Planctomycetaceae bacterium]
MLNLRSHDLCQRAAEAPEPLRVSCHRVAGALLVDAGIATTGSLDAGLLMARVCLGGAAQVSFVPEDADRLASDWGVAVRTDHPVAACLGGQYAGWPVSVDKYFAMGSGPMRMARGREEVLERLGLREKPDRIAGVLESTELPAEEVILQVAQECGVEPASVALLAAPAGSLAGTVQVVARSVETALHKLHALGFDVRDIFSAAGVAPLGPPAKPGDVVGGIGRTNDAILYGGRVTLWVDCDQAAIDAVADAVPSTASRDHGRPFAEIFKDYQYDFYQVDPHLFSPAVVQIINRRSGTARRCGQIETDILRASFGT